MDQIDLRAAPLTEESFVILRFSFEQTVNPLHRAKLNLHVCQVTHHPVHVVGHLSHKEEQTLGERALQSERDSENYLPK